MKHLKLGFKRLPKQFINFVQKNRKLVFCIFILIILTLFILFFTSIEKYFYCLASYYFGGESSPKGEFLKIILQLIGGAFLIIGVWATLRQIRIMEQNSVSDKLKIAIEQLGSEKKGIVVGSLHSLHQIAKKDKKLIPQILSTFVSHIKDRMDLETDWSSLSWEEKKKYRIPTEVQTILDILFRNKEKGNYNKIIIDLSNCKLYRANLNYADLRNAYLNKVQLQGAFLSYANLSGVDMEGANISGAQLLYTNLIGAKLSNSFFIGAELRSTKLQFTKLGESHFESSLLNDVHFERAFLREAVFIGCNSVESNFNAADLTNANFSGSRLIRQQFICSTLMETKLYGAYIKNTNFKGAKLVSTRFNGACSKLNSRREEISFNFLNVINQRIDKKTELGESVFLGKLSDEEKTAVIGKFKEEIKDKSLIKKFVNSINNPLFEDTEDIDMGLLSNDIAQDAITKFNKAIQFAGLLLPTQSK